MLPGLARLLDYDRSWLRPDLLAGVTVAAYLVPQVMAYAESPASRRCRPLGDMARVHLRVRRHVPPAVGRARVDHRPHDGVALGASRSGDPTRYAALAAVLALLVGGVCLPGLGVRLGFLADLLSRPVLVGYMAGVAMIMIVSGSSAS